MEPNSVNSTIPQVPQNPQGLTFKIVIAVLLAFLLGGAVFYLCHNQLQLGLSVLQNLIQGNIVCPLDIKTCPDGSMVGRMPPLCRFAPCPTLKPSSPLISIMPSVPADWKTYKDDKEGIEFKYPSAWYAKALLGWTFNIFLEDRPFEIPQETEFMATIQIDFNEVMDSTTDEKYFTEKTLEEGVRRIKDLYDPDTLEVTDLMVGGKKAVQLSGIWGPGMLEGQYFVDTLVQMDNKLLMVSLTNKEFKNIYNQILSTFKFSEAGGEGQF